MSAAHMAGRPRGAAHDVLGSLTEHAGFEPGPGSLARRPPLRERADGMLAAAGAPADFRSDPAQLGAWYDDVDAELARRARDFPACWGGMYRIGDPGLYVTEEDFDEVLPSDLDRWLYMAMSNYGPYGSCEHDLEEFAQAVQDGGGVLFDLGAGTDAIDAAVYYTEDLPENYTADELEELLGERPDLRAELGESTTLDSLEASCASAPPCTGRCGRAAEER